MIYFTSFGGILVTLSLADMIELFSRLAAQMSKAESFYICIGLGIGIKCSPLVAST